MSGCCQSGTGGVSAASDALRLRIRQSPRYSVAPVCEQPGVYLGVGERRNPRVVLAVGIYCQPHLRAETAQLSDHRERFVHVDDIVERAVVVVEAAAALTMLDLLMDDKVQNKREKAEGERDRL